MNPTALARQKVINWRKLFGVFGEALVCRWLELRGFEILERNWRIGRSPEIDIVARTGAGEVVVIEVKTRSGFLHSRRENIESAIESVNARKRSRLRRQSLNYGDFANCRVRRVDLVVVAVPSSIFLRLRARLESECVRRQSDAQFPSSLKLDAELRKVIDEVAQAVALEGVQLIYFEDILRE